MPLAPADALPSDLRSRALVDGFPLHDVWQTDLPGTDRECTIPVLLDVVASRGTRGLPWIVNALFAIRSVAGRVLGLDAESLGNANSAVRTVPPALATTSRVPPGTPQGPFVTLYRDDAEALYAAVNATVDARLLVAIEPTADGHRLTWATWVRPVGRITVAYMALIDPFRRHLVYPGLERWLRDAWVSAGGR